MGGVGEILYVAQVVFLIVILFPITYWIMMKTSKFDQNKNDYSLEEGATICIILPMRNEKLNVKRKLDSIITEMLSYDSAKLIVANSNSEDGTGEIANEHLKSSELDKTKWDVIDFHIPGKNIALNGVLDGEMADIIVISDADAEVSPGWLDVVISRLGEEEIGVVSGIENESKIPGRGFNSYYRSKSNWLRIHESDMDSTPVLEGSLLAWKQAALGAFKLSEKSNADDAQIGLRAIRKGFRAIVDPRINFHDFDMKKRTFAESTRRSQGLSIALMSNCDLVLRGARKKSRAAILNALILYVIFPWSALLFGVNSFVIFSIYPTNEHSLGLYCLVLVLSVPLFSGGRALIWGALISVFSHLQLIFGKRYDSWEPVR